MTLPPIDGAQAPVRPHDLAHVLTHGGVGADVFAFLALTNSTMDLRVRT
jgi:hypothetical protein